VLGRLHPKALHCWPSPKTKSSYTAHAGRCGRARAGAVTVRGSRLVACPGQVRWRRPDGKVDGVSTTEEGATRRATLEALRLTDGLRRWRGGSAAGKRWCSTTVDSGRWSVVGGVPGWSCSNMRRRGDDVHGEAEENQSRMTLTEEGV
jgi:hypothetical protein